MKKLIIVILSILILLNCQSEPARMYNLNVSRPAKLNESLKKELSTEVCGYQFLFWIPINLNERFQKAYQSLEYQAGANSYITDVEISESWFWAYVLTGYCTKLNAVAYDLGTNPQTTNNNALFNDIAILKNGTTITDCKAAVTGDSVVLTTADGKTSVYKKEEIQSIKKR